MFTARGSTTSVLTSCYKVPPENNPKESTIITNKGETGLYYPAKKTLLNSTEALDPHNKLDLISSSAPTTATHTFSDTTADTNHLISVSKHSGGSGLSFQSIKAAWKSLTSITSSQSSSRLPHLERQTETNFLSSHSANSSHQNSADYSGARYTTVPVGTSAVQQLLSAAAKNKSNPHNNCCGGSSSSSSSTTPQQQHNTHVYLSPSSRSYTNPNNRSCGACSHGCSSSSRSDWCSGGGGNLLTRGTADAKALAKCLRRSREKQKLSEKSKSDNALQKIGVNLKSHSDQNLHKVWQIGGNSCCRNNNSIFTSVHLSGGSGESSSTSQHNHSSSSTHNSTKSKRRKRLLAGIGLEEERRKEEERSRSLERHHGNRIHKQTRDSSTNSRRHTRSLERNHKFRIDLRNILSPQSTSSSSQSSQCPHNTIEAIVPDHRAPSPPTSPPSSLDLHTKVCRMDSDTSSTTPLHGGAGGCNGTQPLQGERSFINKPARGWLHSDAQISDKGVSYGVRYIGCLEVNTSMKSLNFDTRSLIAKECISRVCEAAKMKTIDKKRKSNKPITRILGEKPILQYAGNNVTLSISSTSLSLTTLDSNVIIAHHDMPNISFASGGDADTLDFIAYVAKCNTYGRACFVLECGGGQAQNVITSIGQAFELRFKQYLQKTPPNTTIGMAAASDISLMSSSASSTKTSSVFNTTTGGANSQNADILYTTLKNERMNRPPDDRDYYNDLPGKVPPDITPTTSQTPAIPPLPSYTGTPQASKAGNLNNEEVRRGDTSVGDLTAPPGEAPRPPSTPGLPNLIDLSSEPQTPLLRSEPEYVNDSVLNVKAIENKMNAVDPFALRVNNNQSQGPMHPEGVAPPSGQVCLPIHQRMQLVNEVWYHGPITRKQAEELLQKDGDFLVRECQGTAGQYVLTGVQNNIKKHLLLVDPSGIVRTKHQKFSSVSHLINYHKDNELPIVSAESTLMLRTPVIRRNTPTQPR